MQDLIDTLRRFGEQLNFDQIPAPGRVLEVMDPVAWTLVTLLAGAVVVGLFLRLSTRRSFLKADEVEVTPKMVLARLKQDPTRLSPIAIVSRLGADTTLELLEYGDQIRTHDWRYKWSSVREDLLRLLSQQNAFGPTYALARYYRSADSQEPDTLRIRRTALIHKLGALRHLEPDADGNRAELRIRCHPAEVEGDLGFDGETVWLLPDEPAAPPVGPVIEMDPIDFRTLQDAELHLHIRRTPSVGGGFRLQLQKRRNLWVVVDEEMEWVS
ncbi:MAG TPA: hypothetical protein PKE45_05385 [Caldilineaceae bacterium]|nr:hypothetical protein [Caldilineaceae bacterium]